MRNILLKIEYDGTEFSGWQRQPQPDGQTPQEQDQSLVESFHSALLIFVALSTKNYRPWKKI